MAHTMNTYAPRVLIISHDVVGERMAGPGIRYWEMASVLATQQSVTLVAPQPIDRAVPDFACGSYTWGDTSSLAPWLATADVVVANGFVLVAHPDLASIAQPLVLDLYDPTLLENLELFRSAPEAQRRDQNRQDVELLNRQLAAGDFFLCATERQRDLYLGALMAAGRITPEATERDPQLRSLIDVAPFGLPTEPPTKRQPVLRNVVPGIGADDVLLLWTGGLWDWLDPLSLVQALPGVAAQHPNVRLVFLAGQHPGNVAPMRMPQATKRLAAELDLLDRHVFFYDTWVPYDQRADFLLEADIAVSLHRNHLETQYAAVRSRFLDHLWAGLPSIVSDGDAAADLVQTHGLGSVVATQDIANTATTLARMIADEAARRACAEQARILAATFTWERTLAPLRIFCMRPSRMSKPTQSAAPQAAPSHSESVSHTPIAQLDQLWHVQPHELTSELPLVGQAKQAANTLTRWYLQPILEQQNAFNAAVVHALQYLAETTDRSRDELVAHLEQLMHTNASLQQHIADIELHLCDIDDAQTSLAERLVVPEQPQ